MKGNRLREINMLHSLRKLERQRYASQPKTKEKERYASQSEKSAIEREKYASWPRQKKQNDEEKRVS